MKLLGFCTHGLVVPEDRGKALPISHGSKALALHMAVSMSVDFICSLHVDSGLPLAATGVPNQPGLQGMKG